ncbi:hypothetical protein FACS189487_06210 [Campylobacterota bacterium]|nr:hypothetical protein FACS189487_06210 [Campylobacterota bacterium]
MSSLFFQPNFDDRFQDIIFNDDPDEVLPWEETYYPLIRANFGKLFSDEFGGFKIAPNPDNKKRRKNIDIQSISATSILILSQRAVNAIDDIIKSCGQYLPVIFDWKDYCAFHVTRTISNAVIWEQSEYREDDQGKILYRPTLKEEMVRGEDIFMLCEDSVRIYFSQRLIERCESSQLKGFNFSSLRPIQAI